MTRYWATIVRVYPNMNDYVDTYETYESAMTAAGQILIDFDPEDARRKSIIVTSYDFDEESCSMSFDDEEVWVYDCQGDYDSKPIKFTACEGGYIATDGSRMCKVNFDDRIYLESLMSKNRMIDAIFVFLQMWRHKDGEDSTVSD